MRNRLVRRTLLAIAALLALPPIGLVLLLLQSRYEHLTRYDRSNPDYRYIKAQTAEGASGTIEPQRLNGGNWQLVCLFGPYNSPENVLPREARLRGIALERMEPVNPKFLGLYPVEESEGAVSIVDDAGVGRTFFVEGYERLACQYTWRCFDKSVTSIPPPHGCEN